MLKSGIFLFLIILVGCSNPSEPKKMNDRTSSPVRSKALTIKSAANSWTISSFAPKEGEKEGRKFIRFVSEGDFSNPSQNKSYLYAELIFNKESAGILLHEQKKSSQVEKFSEPVQIKISNSSGQELQMISSRRWNSSGGILIEKNNNDYSQFRIFLLQNKGTLTIEIKVSGDKIYRFNINADGFSDSFNKL